MCPWQTWLKRTTVYQKLSVSHSLSTRVVLTIWCTYSHRQALLQQMVSSTAMATAPDSACMVLIKTDGVTATAVSAAVSAQLLLIRVHGTAATALEALGMLMDALGMLVDTLGMLKEAAPASKCCLMQSKT